MAVREDIALWTSLTEARVRVCRQTLNSNPGTRARKGEVPVRSLVDVK